MLGNKVQTHGGMVIEDLRFEFAPGKNLSALLYRPPNASPSTPAPGILAVHGYINSRETQSAFAIEFARRGYVVLVIDQTGHGFSDGTAFSEGYGGPAALTYLRSLPYVDTDNLGLVGHSMGGWAGLAAAADRPDGYRAIALVGSSTGPGYAPEGSREFPHNLGVIFSRYDEFAELMWGVERAADVVRSDKLKGVFGSAEAIQPGRVYGDIDAGTARWLATPATTHPGDHLSPAAVADTLQWMGMTLKGGAATDTSEQIWFWKELGTLISLVGGFVLLLGSVDLLLTLSAFRNLCVPGEAALEAIDGRWAAGLMLTTLLPAASYFPLTGWGAAFEPNPLFPQGVTNRILVWAFGNAIFAMLLMRIFRPRTKGGAQQAARSPDRGRTTVLALAAVGMVYLAVALSAAWFKTDFRFWVVALKPMAAHHVLPFLCYLLPFVGCFFLTQRAWIATGMLRRPAPLQYVTSVIASAEGLTLMLIGIYAWLFAQGRLPEVDPLFSIVAIQFVVVLTATAIVSVFAWRRTGNVLLGSLLSGLMVTWYIVAGQATHVR